MRRGHDRALYLNSLRHNYPLDMENLAEAYGLVGKCLQLLPTKCNDGRIANQDIGND